MQDNNYDNSQIDDYEYNDTKKQIGRPVKSSKKDGLSFRTRKFIKNYTEGNTLGNGTQSAIKAGYSKASAAQTASRLLTNKKVLAVLNSHVEDAEGVIVSLMNNGNEDSKVRLAAARDVLDRTIGKPLQRTESVSVIITPESMLDTSL